MAEPTPAVIPPPFAALPGDHPAQAYGALPARDLVRRVQQASDDPRQADSEWVFAAFYHRYAGFLGRVVARQLGRLHDAAAQEIVHDALLDFFVHSRRFDADRAPDDDACEGNIRRYLMSLVRWKASDARAFHQSIGAHAAEDRVLDHHLNEQTRAGAPDEARREATAEPSPRARRAEHWIGALSERDADIFRTYFLDDHPGQKSARLPAGVVETLMKKYGCTDSNIRFLKGRLLREFKAYVSQTDD